MKSEISNKIDSLWNSFWAGGISNPLIVIEQITYIIFYKRLAEMDEENGNIIFQSEDEKENLDDKKKYRWSIFKMLPDEERYELFRDRIFPFIKTLGSGEDSAFSKHMRDAVFQIKKMELFNETVKALMEINTHDTDIMGDLYEYLMKKLQSAGTNGQFRTPRHIIVMIIRLMKPTINDIICDPACGSAGFLMAASKFILEDNAYKGVEKFGKNELNHKKNTCLLNDVQWKHFKNTMFYGSDFDNSMLRISSMNMILHGVDNPNIEYYDSLSKDYNYDEMFTMVLANPPFTGSLDEKNINPKIKSIVSTRKTEILFLALFLRILKNNGRGAVIIPEGVLFNSSRVHKKVRQLLIEENALHAIITMPSGVFKPYAGVSTAILIFTKNGNTDKIWFYEMESDGFTLDDRRSELGNGIGDIEDIIENWEKCQVNKEISPNNNDKWFWVSKDEIIKNDYNFNVSNFKETNYTEMVYDDPKDILEKILDLENEVIKDMLEIKDLMEL